MSCAVLVRHSFMGLATALLKLSTVLASRPIANAWLPSLLPGTHVRTGLVLLLLVIPMRSQALALTRMRPHPGRTSMPPRLPLPMGVVVVPYIAWPALAGLLLAMTTLTSSLLKVAMLLCHPDVASHSLAPPGPRVGQQAGSFCLAAIFTAWNASRCHKPAPTRAAELLERCTGVGKKLGLSLLARAVLSYRYIDDQAACDYGRCAPPKLYDDFIYHAELIVSRAYFFSRWCVNAGIAIDKPIRSRGKRGKKNEGRR